MTPVPHIVFATHFNPLASGHGGHHRAYQIAHDLAQAAGSDQVTIISHEAWKTSHPRAQPRSTPPAAGRDRARRTSLINKLAFMLKYRVPYLRVTHPIDLLMDTSPVLQWYAAPEFARFFTDTLRHLPRPLLVVVEHTSLAKLLFSGTPQEGLVAIACPQNIESFDSSLPTSREEPRPKYLAALSFADEWKTLERCDRVFCISRVEAGLFSSLGMAADYYPYRPTGSIREYFESIRTYRTAQPPQDKIMLMLGSCEHKTTHQAFSDFLQHHACDALPPGYQLVVAGSGTTTLPVPKALASRLNMRGRVSDEEMKSWLVQAAGVFLPQQMGFGALTRLSELACAGVPTAVSRHVTFSMDLPPGIQVVNEPTRDWPDMGRQFASGLPPCSGEEYASWEEAQPSPWEKVLSQWGILAALPPCTIPSAISP